MRTSLRLSLVRLLLWFISGIILSGLISPVHLIPLILPLFLLCGLTGLFCLVFYQDLAHSRRWIPGIIIAAFYLLSGYVMIIASDPAGHPLHLTHLEDPVTICIGTVTEPSLAGKKSIRFTLSLISVRDQERWRRVEGKVIVYCKKDIPLPEFVYGDTLLIRTGLFPVAGPMNPGQFSYKRYLARRNIYHQAYLAPGNYCVTGHMKAWTIKRMANLTRQRLSDILRESGLKERECATAQALLLGDKSQIDDETYQAYSSSGTIHILCVSGLHVGVIYMVLDFLLGFLSRSKPVKWIRFLLIILLIWFYAFLTGLTPSVLRATVMFSILIIGKAYRRNTNIYNTLACSALLLLSANPFMLYDTGFQLSYLAVVGIVSLEPWIRDQLTFRGWLLNKIWALMCVSLAAQLMTLPLTVLLFHQFPSYFLIANVLVVPLSGFIIYAGILVFITHPVPFLWKAVCWIFGMMIRGMNETVTFIEGLPYSTLTGLPLDGYEMVLLYIIILASIYLLVYRMEVALFFLLAAFAILSGYKLTLSQQMIARKQLVVYSTMGSTAVGLIRGREGTFVMDSALLSDPMRIKMHLKGHWVRSRIKRSRLVSLSDTLTLRDPDVHVYNREPFSILQLEECNIILINSRLYIKQNDSTRIKVNYILLRNNATVSIKDVVRVIDAEYIIADMSSSKWRVKKWKKESMEQKVCFYDTAEKGAFIRRWK